MTTKTTKYISNSTMVDLTKSRRVWDNGKTGDARVELWADEGNVHVWAETNGDPVYGESELRDCLIDEGMAAAAVEQVIAGNLSSVIETDEQIASLHPGVIAQLDQAYAAYRAYLERHAGSEGIVTQIVYGEITPSLADLDDDDLAALIALAKIGHAHWMQNLSV